MPRTKVVLYREEDGSVPPREIDLALEQKRKFQADPQRHTYAET